MSQAQAEPRTPPRRRLAFDAQGRAIVPTEAELDEIAKSAAPLAEALASIPDTDPPGEDEAVMRAIDEGRPERPLFRGLY